MKKIVSIVVIIIVLAAAAYYYFFIKEPAEPIIWDGSYKMTGTLTCEGNFPNLTTIPMDSTVVVTNNKIVEQIGDTVQNFDIDKRGRATEIIDPVTNQGVTVSGKATYKFYIEDGVYKFTGEGTTEVSATQNETTYASTCSGTVVGIKQ
jgi:hypothetical protein